MQLAEVFQLAQWQIVAGQVQQAIDQHGAVTIRQNETVAVGPQRVGWVVVQVAAPEYFSDVRHAHWGTRMSRFRFLYCIHT